MFDPIRRVSAADIAGATVLAVVSIDAPSELNSRAGSTNGAMCLVTQNVAGINEWTLYAFDAASSGGVNSPYVLAASGSGQWIAFAGKYVNSAHLIAGAVTLAKSSGTSLTLASTDPASATTAGGYTSTVATGTAPFTATSTTVCPNLNASRLNGTTWTAPGAIGGGTPGTAAFTTMSATGQITSTLAIGTAPFSITSTTVVPNLNVSQLLGNTWAAPGAIGGTTPGSAAHTTISASGQITSTLATGTAPLVVASTTVVANLNVAQLNGATFAAPGAIGGTTPGTAAFTTLTATAGTLPMSTILSDAVTNSFVEAARFSHSCSGTAAAGIGVYSSFGADTTTTPQATIAYLIATWTNATHAARTGRLDLQVQDSATNRAVLRMEANGSAPLIGFLGASASVRQTSGADLTNNVTSGGTTDQIDNFTSLTVYATDAAAIRNDIYQLARKLKQVNDALRLYGLLT